MITSVDPGDVLRIGEWTSERPKRLYGFVVEPAINQDKHPYTPDERETYLETVRFSDGVWTPTLGSCSIDDELLEVMIETGALTPNK